MVKVWGCQRYWKLKEEILEVREPQRVNSQDLCKSISQSMYYLTVHASDKNLRSTEDIRSWEVIFLVKACSGSKKKKKKKTNLGLQLNIYEICNFTSVICVYVYVELKWAERLMCRIKPIWINNHNYPSWILLIISFSNNK